MPSNGIERDGKKPPHLMPGVGDKKYKMTENNPSMISNSIQSLLDALQKNTLFLATISFLIVISNYAKDGFKVAGIDVPNIAVFHVSVSLLFYAFWNFSRLSSKLRQIIEYREDLSTEERLVLFSHHFLLSPFNRMELTKLTFTDCLPISIIFYLVCAIGKYVVCIFNNSQTLYTWAAILPIWLRNILVWSITVILVLLYVSFIKNIGEIVKKIKLSTHRYYVFVISQALSLTIIEELIKFLGKS